LANRSQTKKTKAPTKPSPKGSSSSSPKKGGGSKAKASAKPTPKKPAAKKSAKSKAAPAKKPVTKPVTKKAPAKKASLKKDTAKTAKKANPTPVAKTPAKAVPKPGAKAEKPAQSAKPPAPKAGPKAEIPPKPEAVAPQPPGDKGGARKGITIVSKKPARKPKAKSKTIFSPPGDRLLGPGSPIRRPLIPSGPSATPRTSLQADDASKPRKSPFGKRELDKFRALLLAKRAELLGDVEQIENDALRSESGELSHFPQHMADQGSDSFERSLSLDLAAVDRRLIKEIDDALQRLADGVYGLCEMTGRPIAVPRLLELPWARYSIEAAREIERRGGF
jgi:RNA polymerase-binding transcription factor DksA